MSPTETARTLAVIAAAYPNFAVSETTLAVWTEMLDDLEYGAVSAAVRRHIAVSRFAPSIAEIREQTVAVDRTGIPTAAEAWGNAWAAARHWGNYHPVEAFAEMGAEAAYVVGLMGWDAFCMETEFGVIRGQFLKMYQQVEQRDAREALLPAGLRTLGQRRGGDLERVGDMMLIADGQA